MLIYNALPFAYKDIDQLTEQLPDIKEMGFQTIWINPFQYSRRYHGYLGGSIYSMTDDSLFLSQWRQGDIGANEAALARLSHCANQHGITLMFDLVMNQVGRSLPKIKQFSHLFSNPDRGQFDYSSKQKQEQIFEVFFAPFIERYVRKYGFTGMRIDAAGIVPPYMQYLAIRHFKALCRECHHCEGVVLGEYLESNDKLQSLMETGVHYDVITNSSHWSVNTSPYFDPHKRAEHNYDMGVRRKVAAKHGTIGWTGNHDVDTLYQTCLKKLPQHTRLTVQEKNRLLAKMMREQIAVMAFISDGGYYLLCGDEFGSAQRRSCFEYEQDRQGEPALRPGQTIKEKWGGQFDMRDFIRQVNFIRQQLGSPIDMHFWSEQYKLDDGLDPHHEVKCIVRNNGGGFSGQMDIIFVNVNPGADFVFDIHEGHVRNVLEKIKAQHPDFPVGKSDIRLHLAGSFNVLGRLPLECFASHVHDEVAKLTREFASAKL